MDSSTSMHRLGQAASAGTSRPTSLGAEMANEGFPSVKQMVIADIRGVLESVGSLPGSDEHLSDEDTRAMLECWGSLVQSQGVILARMSLLPWKKAERKSSMSGIVNRSPAWLNAHFRGEGVMTLELFAEGIAQTLARQRVEFEQVLIEQIEEPAPIQALLDKAPLPAEPGKVERSELLSAVAGAMNAHTEALVEIAADLDEKFCRHIGSDLSEP